MDAATEPTEEEVIAAARLAFDSGEPTRAATILEAYAKRHPERALAWRADELRDRFGASQREKGEAPPRMPCLRCRAPMPFAGRLRLHEGKHAWGFWLGNVGELLVNRRAFDAYACPRCGHVELFLEGAARDVG